MINEMLCRQPSCMILYVNAHKARMQQDVGGAPHTSSLSRELIRGDATALSNIHSSIHLSAFNKLIVLMCQNWFPWASCLHLPLPFLIPFLHSPSYTTDLCCWWCWKHYIDLFFFLCINLSAHKSVCGHVSLCQSVYRCFSLTSIFTMHIFYK